MKLNDVDVRFKFYDEGYNAVLTEDFNIEVRGYGIPSNTEAPFRKGTLAHVDGSDGWTSVTVGGVSLSPCRSGFRMLDEKELELVELLFS